MSERRGNFRRVSGRNQLVGRVTDVKISGLMAQSESLSIGGQAHHVRDHRGRGARDALAE